MWIKRQEGYCLKEIAGVHYLLPYGQKVSDEYDYVHDLQGTSN